MAYRYKNKLGIYNQREGFELVLAIHPRQKHLDKPIAEDLIAQVLNSSCYKTSMFLSGTFPCVINFKEEANISHTVYALNKSSGIEVEQATEYFHQELAKYTSSDGSIHHTVLTKAICDYFDAVLLYSWN